MSRRPWLRVALDDLNDSAAVSGPGAGSLIQRAGGKLFWSPARKAWMTNRRIAVDVLALADVEGRKVTYTEDKHLDRGDQDLVDRGGGGDHLDLGGVA